MAPEGVTIDLKEKPPDKDPPKEKIYEGDLLATDKNIIIKVTGSGIYSDFLKYEHTLYPNLNQPFRLLKVLDDTGNNVLNGIPLTNNVTSVSAYYWKYENGPGTTPGKALLVEVVSSGADGKKYYRNSKSGIWAHHTIGNSGHPTKEDLELLNCEVNNAVIIDLSYGTGGSYCCDKHGKDSKDGGGKVSVQEVPVHCKEHDHTSNPIPYYKHRIDPNSKLADIRYDPTNGSTRNRVNIPDLQNFYLWCQGIYVLYCNQNNPALIYVEGHGNNGTNRWYKKPSTDSEEWTPVLDKLNSIKPDELSNPTSHERYNDLVKALNETAGCGNLKECTLSRSAPKPPAKSIAGGLAAAQGSGHSSGPPQDSSWKVILGAFSGTGIVSGLVGFVGFKYYKSRSGDTWVRQI